MKLLFALLEIHPCGRFFFTPYSFFQSCLGQSRFNTFKKRTGQKKLLTDMTGGDPHQAAKWKSRPAWKAPGGIRQLQYISRVAFDSDTSRPSSGVTVCTGPRRCMTGNAQLMVLGSMKTLHYYHDNEAHLCDLIYIIGLGLPTVVASTWAKATGAPGNLNAKHVCFHVPAISQARVFQYTQAFAEVYAEVIQALGHCADRPKSKWKVQRDSHPARAGDVVVKVANLGELAKEIMKLRKLEEGALRGYRISVS
jgi:hypothetical protein